MNFTKKFFSYFKDIHLESIQTSSNPQLDLYLSNGQLKLMAPEAIYSYGLHYHHFVQCFENLQISKSKINEVLILGLGMGSIIQILEKYHKIQAHYDLVEYDAELIALFQKYSRFITNAKFHLHNRDALDFVKSCTGSYDLICMDVFNDRIVPEKFETKDFLMSLKDVLAENGILIYNRIAMDAFDIESNSKFADVFKHVFDSAFVMQCAYNAMFIFQNGDN